jgi:hypothetical protein
LGTIPEDVISTSETADGKAALMDDHAHAELLALFEQATQDIRTFQGRQASVTQLAVTADAALVALRSLAIPYLDVPRVVLLLVFLVALGGSVWLILLQWFVRDARAKLRGVEAHFSPEFLKVRGKPDPHPDWFEGKYDVAGLQLFCVVIAALLTWMALWVV